MKFGLHSVNLHSCGYPETASRLAQAAEAAGFESLWVADHVVLPDPPMPQRPMAPDMRLLDPVVMLTFYAALTTRIRLATGVIVLPQRQPGRALERSAYVWSWRWLVCARVSGTGCAV